MASARRKVLHYVPWLMSGGVERRRLELARGLEPSKYEQRIVCLTANRDLRSAFDGAGVHVHELGVRFGTEALLRGAAIAREWRPAIIHGAVFEGISMATCAASVCGTRLAVEEIDYPIHRSWRGNALFRLLALRANVCIGVSQAVVQYLRTIRVPEHKIRLIVNGISEPRLVSQGDRERLRGSLGIPPGALVIGTIGRLHDAHKRFSDLIRGLAQLRQAGRNVRLVILGEGRDHAALEMLARNCHVADVVTFAGYQSDIGPFLSIFDVFALPSNRESFGLVIVEAMFAGLPVVATRAGGIPQIVEDGRTGILVPVGDLVRLSRALDELLTDPERRRSMGDRGRSRARRLFGVGRYVQDVDRLYDDLLLGSPPGYARLVSDRWLDSLSRLRQTPGREQ